MLYIVCACVVSHPLTYSRRSLPLTPLFLYLRDRFYMNHRGREAGKGQLMVDFRLTTGGCSAHVDSDTEHTA